jgi:hypothetical protein
MQAPMANRFETRFGFRMAAPCSGWAGFLQLTSDGAVVVDLAIEMITYRPDADIISLYPIRSHRYRT